jgi:hypothetical protein
MGGWPDGKKVKENDGSPGDTFAPLWQLSPANATAVNVNLFSDKRFTDMYTSMIETRQTIMSFAFQVTDLYDFAFSPAQQADKVDPHVIIMDPVYSSIEEESPKVEGFLVALTSYASILDNKVHEGANGFIAVITPNTNACNQIVVSYELNGPEAIFLGYEDLHDPAFDQYERTTALEVYETTVEGLCAHTVRDTYSERHLICLLLLSGVAVSSLLFCF